MHLDAVEHGHSIVFLHVVEAGPANQSYGIQVAALAGIPAAVVRAAKWELRELESRAAVDPLQPDLFAVARLAALDPDALSPREALAALYELRGLVG